MTANHEEADLVIKMIALIFQTLTFVVVLCAFSFTKRQFRLLRTSSYIERYSTAPFLEVRVAVDTKLYALEKLDIVQQLQAYEAMLRDDEKESLQLRHRFWTLTMLFNEIGLAYETGAIHGRAIENFDRLLPRYWHRLKPYIFAMHYRFGYRLKLVIKDGRLHLENPIQERSAKNELALFNNFRLGYLTLKQQQIAKDPHDILSGEAPIPLVEHYKDQLPRDGDSDSGPETTKAV